VYPADDDHEIASISRSLKSLGTILLFANAHGDIIHFDLTEPFNDNSSGVVVRVKAPAKLRMPSLLSQSTQKKQEEEKKEEGSFLSKYWHIIIPIMIFMMLSGPAAEENKEGGGDQAGGGGGTRK